PLHQCHGGLSDQDYQRMYEASVFRDEGMAKVIAEELRRMRAQPSQSESGPDAGSRPGPILSYTGAGHIQYYLPVPNRVLRRVGSPVKQISIYLTAFDPARSQEIHEYLRDRIGD